MLLINNFLFRCIVALFLVDRFQEQHANKNSFKIKFFSSELHSSSHNFFCLSFYFFCSFIIIFSSFRRKLAVMYSHFFVQIYSRRILCVSMLRSACIHNLPKTQYSFFFYIWVQNHKNVCFSFLTFLPLLHRQDGFATLAFALDHSADDGVMNRHYLWIIRNVFTVHSKHWFSSSFNEYLIWN